MNLFKSIFIASFFAMVFIGVPFDAFAQNGNDCAFEVRDTYNHQCALLKNRTQSTADAVRECSFKVDVSGCAKSIVASTTINDECYAFARRHNGDDLTTELCTFKTYRCKL